jgi:cytochrome c peroxidase
VRRGSRGAAALLVTAVAVLPGREGLGGEVAGVAPSPVIGASAGADGAGAPAIPATGAAAAPPPRPLTHDDTSYTYAVGGFVPEYTIPPPGSYELPPIDTISDHPLVDASGNATTLGAVLGGRIAVVSFIYASCSEKAGCPMSTQVLRSLDRTLSTDAALSRDVALVTVSFDPEHDTPERLSEMQKLRTDTSSWRFVTASDEAALAPLLDDFGQSVSKLRRADGSWTGAFRHVLKVYLLDRRQRVRNVYSAGFLHPDLVMADVKTLEMEEKSTAAK